MSEQFTIGGLTINEIRNKRLPLDWYKENISIVDFALYHYNFQINTKHTPKFINDKTRWVTIYDPSSGNNFLCRKTINPQTNKPNYLYSNVNCDSIEPTFGTHHFDNGSIFDFVMGREPNMKVSNDNYKTPTGDIIRILKNFCCKEFPEKLNEGRMSYSNAITVSENIPTGPDLFKYFSVSKLAESNPYYQNFLNIRSIPPNVYNNPIFKDRIYFREFANNANSVTKQLCFPITSRSKNAVVGFFTIEQFSKNDSSIKRIAGIKFDGLWFSNFDKTKPLDSLLVVENPIDAISYYYCHPDLQDKNILFCASIGQVSIEQCNALTRIANDYKPKELIFANDNDVFGQKFNLFELSNVNYNKSSFKRFTCDQRVYKDQQATVSLDFDKGTSDSNLKALDWIRDNVDKLTAYDIKSGLKPSIIYTPVVLPTSEHPDVAKCMLHFISRKDNWKEVSLLVSEFAFDKGISCQIDVPCNKDWNEDLSQLDKRFQLTLHFLDDKAPKPTFNEFIKEYYPMMQPEETIKTQEKENKAEKVYKEVIAEIKNYTTDDKLDISMVSDIMKSYYSKKSEQNNDVKNDKKNDVKDDKKKILEVSDFPKSKGLKM